MQATLLTAEHQTFRETLRAFIRKEILPHIDRWEKDNQIDKSIWKKWVIWAFWDSIIRKLMVD